MKWKISYYSVAVHDEVLSLPKTLLARYLRFINLMIHYGPNLGEPHTKYLEDGLLEIRIKGQEGIARVFYCTLKDKEIIVLHSLIKKQQKIPSRDLKVAKDRMKEVKS